jgi:hypothetical protein
MSWDDVSYRPGDTVKVLDPNRFYNSTGLIVALLGDDLLVWGLRADEEVVHVDSAGVFLLWDTFMGRRKA